MKTQTKTLNVKGINTPKLLLFIRGFIHGKLHTGGLNPETNKISSAYITGQNNNFRKSCYERIEALDGKLNKAWVKMAELLIDLDDNAKKKIVVPETDMKETSKEIRTREKAREDCKRKNAERITLLKSLSDILITVNTEITRAEDEMKATAELLKSSFAAYGHGLIMQPIFNQLIPDVYCDDCISDYRNQYKDTLSKAIAALKEVE